MMAAHAPYYLHFDEWNRDIQTTRAGTIADFVDIDSGNQKHYYTSNHRHVASRNPVDRYVLDQRRYMPWQISNPLFMSLSPQTTSGISIAFLNPEPDMLDLTLLNGFCPAFHKKNVTCVATGRTTTTGETVQSCTAEEEVPIPTESMLGDWST